MTPKEKAKELVKKAMVAKTQSGFAMSIHIAHAKVIATFAADEIINTLTAPSWGNQFHVTATWWKWVKEEINKL